MSKNKISNIIKGIRVSARDLRFIEWGMKKTNFNKDKFIKLFTKDFPKLVLTVSVATWGVIGSSVEAFAVTGASPLAGATKSLMGAVAPLLEFFASVGYPVTYFMIIIGLLMIITGRKSAGLEMIKWACIGFLALQFVPFLMNMLVVIGSELRKSVPVSTFLGGTGITDSPIFNHPLTPFYKGIIDIGKSLFR